MFDIVALKQEIYQKRFKAEYCKELQSEGMVKDEIERIRDELFSHQFDKETNQLIVHKFQKNLGKLKDFMLKVDKEIEGLLIFNQKDVDQSQFEDVTSKYSSINSVSQLKNLLHSYDALSHCQSTVISESLSKLHKIPTPEDISSHFSRFHVLKESELSEMQVFVEEQKARMRHQYDEFDKDRKTFTDISKRMENEKLKISEERERIESEVRRIKELNGQLQGQI